MKRALAIALFLLLTLPILVYWLEVRWILALLQTGSFALAAAWLVRNRMMSVERFRTAPAMGALVVLVLIPICS